MMGAGLGRHEAVGERGAPIGKGPLVPPGADNPARSVTPLGATQSHPTEWEQIRSVPDLAKR